MPEGLSKEQLQRASLIFEAAPFISSLGIKLEGLGSGWCESSLVLRPKHMQQNDVVHAGVQSTMADHTAGAAAGTLAASHQIVLTADFNIQLLRAARGDRLRCRAEVVKPGKNLTFVESSVYCITGDTEKLVAKLSATMALV